MYFFHCYNNTIRNITCDSFVELRAWAKRKGKQGSIRNTATNRRVCVVL